MICISHQVLLERSKGDEIDGALGTLQERKRKCIWIPGFDRKT